MLQIVEGALKVKGSKTFHFLSEIILKTQVYISKYFQRKIINIFLRINFNKCFGRSKEPSH